MIEIFTFSLGLELSNMKKIQLISNNFPTKLNYIPSLDGMRAVAVLLVLFSHAGIAFPLSGGTGVGLFFTLSGFLITSILLAEIDVTGGISLKKFYVRRAYRLIPAFWILLLSFSIVELIYYKTNLDEWLHELIPSFFYFSNWTRAFDLHYPVKLGHTWSLAIEEQFYLLFPPILIFMLTKASKQKILLGIILVCVLCYLYRILMISSGASISRVYSGLDTRADALLIGCGVAFALNVGWRPNKILVNITILFSLIILWTKSFPSQALAYSVLALFSAGLIIHLVISKNSVIKRILETSILVYIGKISYGIYLFHYPIFLYLRNTVGQGLPLLLAGGGITIIAAVMSYHFVEQPILAKSRAVKQF